jgi:hypothetical protein
MYLELVETPEGMPYADDAADRLYGPSPSWEYRPERE